MVKKKEEEITKKELRERDIIVCVAIAIVLFVAYFAICKCKEYYETIAGNHYLELYEKVVDYTVQNNKDYFENIEYISFDYNSFKIYGNGEQQSMLNYLQKYNEYVILGSMNLLLDNDFVNDDGSISGVFIKAERLEQEDKNVSCDFLVYKSEEDNLKYTFNAKYNNGKWKINYTTNEE